MYDYEWDAETGGYILTTRTGKFVANEIRPVFVEELELTGLSAFFTYERTEKRPYLWAQKNTYYYRGEKVAQCNGVQYGRPMDITCFFEGIMELEPVNIERMVSKNSAIMRAIVDDAKRRTKELYDANIADCDKAYIAFSGGKDSIALLHLCNEVLPLDVPVIFSDTDMELEHMLFGKGIEERQKASIHAGLRRVGSQRVPPSERKNGTIRQPHIAFLGRVQL